MLCQLIANHLVADDDAELWETATATILRVAEVAAAESTVDVYAQVGCCRHWISPHHPIRWAPGGSLFAWPFGYAETSGGGFYYRALPELDWSEFLTLSENKWIPGRPSNRDLLFRIAIPARTARHRQAAIHTIWTPRSPQTKEKRIQLFGFRRRGERWVLTATDIVEKRGRTSRR